ncbi:MAG: 2'-5' RNA ligase family protein [Ginsengibacter sp.]
MKPGNFFSYGEHEFFEYMLAAKPDAAVCEKVMTERQIFYDTYKEGAAGNTKPHIAVSSFFAREEMEETIIRWVQRICGKQQGFAVTLNNYSGFPPGTIYLRVQNVKPFQHLAKELHVINTYVSDCLCPPVKFVSKPYITLAGCLPEEIFFKALIQYAHKSFHETFLVNELQLLKRKHQYDTCKSINVFGLQPAEMNGSTNS